MELDDLLSPKVEQESSEEQESSLAIADESEVPSFTPKDEDD